MALFNVDTSRCDVILSKTCERALLEVIAIPVPPGSEGNNTLFSLNGTGT